MLALVGKAGADGTAPGAQPLEPMLLAVLFVLLLVVAGLRKRWLRGVLAVLLLLLLSTPPPPPPPPRPPPRWGHRRLFFGRRGVCRALRRRRVLHRPRRRGEGLIAKMAAKIAIRMTIRRELCRSTVPATTVRAYQPACRQS